VQENSKGKNKPIRIIPVKGFLPQRHRGTVKKYRADVFTGFV
jgi:hypothetical protein